MRINLIVTIATFTLIAPSCTQEPSTSLSQEGKRLQEKLTQAHCIMEQLNQESVQLWDTVVFVMDEQLPETTPPEERTNLLKVRNASLIRMFEVYSELPDSVQLSIDRAEQQDKELAARMKAQIDTIKHYESLANDFLSQVALTHSDSSKVWQVRFADRRCQ